MYRQEEQTINGNLGKKLNYQAHNTLWVRPTLLSKHTCKVCQYRPTVIIHIPSSSGKKVQLPVEDKCLGETE